MVNYNNLSSFYVSQTNGNDTYNGFYEKHINGQAGPFKTLEKAILTVSDMRKQGYLQPVSIRITDEVYCINNPVVISDDLCDVTIEPYTHTTICGAIEINNFVSDRFNGIKCVSADISNLDIPPFSDFYIDGKPATITRYPEEGTLSPVEVEQHTSDFFLGSKWFIAKDEDFEVINRFKNIEDAYISFYHYWIDEHTPIESFDSKTKRIAMKYISRFNMNPDVACANIEYVIENIPDMFNKPGQWYFDKKAKKLYYIPKDNNQSITGYIPVTDKLFIVKGKQNNKVRNICIRNFKLCYTKGEYKSVFDEPKYTNSYKKDGFASDVQSVCEGHGSIEFENAHGCSINNCELNCLGVHGINIKSGCSKINITANKMTYLGGGGVYANGGQVGSDKTCHTYALNITDNTVVNCGKRYYASCGMLLRHVYECNISHNEIGYMQYTGISCGWVWGYADSICHDNIIQNNYIHHLGGGILSDMGGIYTLGKQTGMVISGNVIHDVTSRHYGGWAVYTDEGSRYITVENNICYNTSNNVYHQHYGTMNTVRNNIFAFSKDAPIRHSQNTEKVGIICENNIIVINGNSPFRIRDNYDGDICAIKSNNNFIYDYTGDYNGVYLNVVGDDKSVCDDTMIEHDNKTNEDYNLKYTFEDCCNMNIEQGSMFIDPQFEDIGNFNFNLKSTSPVYEMGFKPIDTSDVGPRKR